ncbi:hypothetical protein DPMN_137204 [Dreissena polymorpha]|uniref:Uncharacterized protein n=1 Tax=Dreissena polymorpha TaxID=45954 RepID=A0A9D4G5B8_DREPO|nr:hypothetical protein DPMN_137204 [Dreissena polymorpha]
MHYLLKEKFKHGGGEPTSLTVAHLCLEAVILLPIEKYRAAGFSIEFLYYFHQPVVSTETS